MPIILRQNVSEVINQLKNEKVISLDTETTGLNAYGSDRLFSLILRGENTDSNYFNFIRYPDIHDDFILDKSVLKEMSILWEDPQKIWCIHNAKFDMSILLAENIELAGTIWCTLAQGRVENNSQISLDLDSLGSQIGHKKDSAVDEYIKKNKLYRKLGEQKVPDFTKVPLNLISKYAMQDAKVCLELYLYQKESIRRQSFRGKSWAGSTLIDVNKTELRLTKTFFNMEKHGIKVDRQFCQKGFNHYLAEKAKASEDFYRLTGQEFNDHHTCLAPAFKKLGLSFPVTEKGNPSFKAEVLEEYNNPLANVILAHRKALKMANTYFRNFLLLSDGHGIIHPNSRQAGTVTGRVSYSDPNFQNLPKPDEDEPIQEWEVRKAVVPRSGYCLVMLDKDQVEYRLMLEYAKEEKVIDAILNKGLDVHQATADMVLISRKQAKTLNFMLLYGGGEAKLCAALFNPTLDVASLKALLNLQRGRLNTGDADLLAKITPTCREYNLNELRKAKELKAKYFEALPGVKSFISRVIATAKDRNNIINWAGRICRFENREFAYKAPNHLIQGGCADEMKIIMNLLDDFLTPWKSKLVLQVHDELVLEMHQDEFHLLPSIIKIMESVYPYRKLPLTVGVEHSWTNWAEKQEGLPNEKAS